MSMHAHERTHTHIHFFLNCLKVVDMMPLYYKVTLFNCYQLSQ